MVSGVDEMKDFPRWFVRSGRPIQQTKMCVSDYYKRFCDWKKEMVCVGYPYDEGSYIDYFIGNLQWHLRLRVSKHRSSLSRLVDAFYATKFDETMFFIEEVTKDIRAAMVLDEMPIRVPIDRQMVSVPDNDGVHIIDALGMIGDTSQASVLENPVCSLLDEMTKTIPTAKAAANSIDDLMEKEACKVFVELFEPILRDVREETIREKVANGSDNPAHYVFDDLPKPSTAFPSYFPIQISPTKPSLEQTKEKDEDDPVRIVLHECKLLGNEMGQPPLSKMRSLEAVRKLFDEMPKRISAELNGELYVIQVYIAHFCYVLQISNTRSSYLLDDGVILSFDPGGYSLSHMGRGLIEINRDQGDYCLETNMAAFLYIEVPWYLLNGLLMQALQHGREFNVRTLVSILGQFATNLRVFAKAGIVAAIILSIISHQADLHRNKELGSELYIVDGQVGLESVDFSHPLRNYIQAMKNATLMVPTGMRTTLVRSIGSGRSTVVAELENFIWDPGQCAIFVYILEDKDVLKRKGIRVRLALKQHAGLNGASTYYNAHPELLACSLIDRDFEEASNNLIKASIKGGDMHIISINVLQQNGYVQTTLFELGYIDVTILHKEMLRTFSLLCFLERHWRSRKTLVVAGGTNLENFVWKPGPYMFCISLFSILEDKDVLMGKDLSGTKLVAILFMLLELFKCFSLINVIMTSSTT